ncbi:hypothetical protein PROSTU_03866 [Providencia stuartii ATCC 25827]|uniref:Uncharacterized protein n=1 Tax=Providencia stuartii ATCC 25827 TaxID=471874 RepID=A0AA86YX84_PROST|nr:hypothetical protein PROSTU_03866 [Providencia stuartii ATCC 25827]
MATKRWPIFLAVNLLQRVKSISNRHWGFHGMDVIGRCVFRKK